MDKTLFLDLIERHYNSQLSRFQLQYFFSSNRYVAASCPRRGGKSFVAIVDSLYTCSTPGKNVALLLPNWTAVKYTKEEINNAMHAFIEVFRIERTTNNVVYFDNGSVLHILSTGMPIDSFRGMRLNKVVIDEPDTIADIEQLKLTLECCMQSYEDAQFKMIGTHSSSRHNLKSYMLSPYFEKVTGTIHTIHNPMNRQRLSELEAEMGDNAQFRLEILNEVSPDIWNN